MFGKDPNRFYPNISVKIGRFVKDDADLRFQDVIEGNMVYLLEEVIKRLGYKYLVQQIEFRGILRIEKGEYPLAAIREMLLNSLVHRVYMGSHVHIRVYDDKISIWNEGVLPFGLNIEALKENHNSRPRNPFIADVCFKAGYIDSWGRGTLKIINSCNEAGLPVPEIIEKDGGIQVTLYKEKIEDSSNSGNITKHTGLVEGLVDSQQKIVKLIAENPQISKKEMAESIGISTTAIDKNISTLRKKNIIERIGGDKTGRWQIIIPQK